MQIRALPTLLALLLAGGPLFAAPSLGPAPPTGPAPRTVPHPAAAPGAEQQDEVHLKSGKVMKGLVVYEDDEVVVLRNGSHDKTYSKDEVESVVSRTRTLQQILDQLDTTDHTDAAALLAIATQAEDAGMDGEAELIRLSALFADPENEAAHVALGHKPSSKGWRFKVGGKWKHFDDWPEIKGTWKERYSFHTTHYELESDMALPKVVQSALDLERGYRAFYGLFRAELELKDIEERMAVHIHSDDASYPESGDGRPGWFSTSDLILFVLGKEKLQGTLVHEGCHQIMYYATQRTRGARGEIPAWVNEGVAQYMEFGVTRGQNGVLIDPGAPDLDSFRLQANHDDPFGLTRMLTMQTSDFRGGTDTPLKFAQAYTLVQFMLHAAEGHYRAAFYSFVRSAWTGQSSMSHFKDTLEKELQIDLDDFEESWIAYVDGIAGT